MAAEDTRKGALQWISLAEITRRTGIPESSLRRHARLFGSFFPQTQSGKRWLFSSDSIRHFELIATAFREGKSAEEVESLLRTTAAAEIPSGGSVVAEMLEGTPAAPPAMPRTPREPVPRIDESAVFAPALAASFMSAMQSTMERMAAAMEVIRERDTRHVLELEEKALRQEELLREQQRVIESMQRKLDQVESVLFLKGDDETTPLKVQSRIRHLEQELGQLRQIQEKEAVERVLEIPKSGAPQGFRLPWWKRLLGRPH